MTSVRPWARCPYEGLTNAILQTDMPLVNNVHVLKPCAPSGPAYGQSKMTMVWTTRCKL